MERPYRRRRVNVLPKTTKRRYPKAAGKSRKAGCKKPATTVAKLARRVRNLTRNQYESCLYRYAPAVTTALPEINLYNLIDPTQYTRTFTSVTDMQETNTAWLNSLRLDWRFQLNENTPDTFPIWISFFLVSPKWAYRQSVSSTTITQMASSQLVNGTHYSYGSNPAQGVMLNKELFRIYAVKYMRLTPPTKTTGGATEVYPRPSDYYKRGSFKLKPKLKMFAPYRTWKEISGDDIPFTRQLAMLFFVNFQNGATQTGSVSMDFWWSLGASINQVSN